MELRLVRTALRYRRGIVESNSVVGNVSAAARCAAVRGMAACATTSAVLVGTENIVTGQTVLAIPGVGLRRGRTDRQQSY